MDNKTNAHGIRLIELCRNNNLFIFNGGIHNDLTGKYTFKDKSVIDYTIATADCFQFIRDFEISMSKEPTVFFQMGTHYYSLCSKRNLSLPLTKSTFTRI